MFFVLHGAAYHTYCGPAAVPSILCLATRLSPGGGEEISNSLRFGESPLMIGAEVRALAM